MKPKEAEVFDQVYANEPFELPLGETWQLACCHCGLVHEVKVEAVGKNFRMTMRENAAATKRLRKTDDALVCKPEKKPRSRKS